MIEGQYDLQDHLVRGLIHEPRGGAIGSSSPPAELGRVHRSERRGRRRIPLALTSINSDLEN